MTNEKMIQSYHQHLEEIEGGLKNLIYRLGAEDYNDLKQDIQIKLIAFNELNGITEDGAKNLFFISTKNALFTALSKRREMISIDDEEINLHLVADESIIGNNEEGLSETNYELLMKLKANITEEEYQLMLAHFNKVGEATPKLITNRIDRVKKRIGYVKTHVIVFEDGERRYYKYLSDAAKDIGIPLTNLSKKILGSETFTYKKVLYKYLLKTNVNI